MGRERAGSESTLHFAPLGAAAASPCRGAQPVTNSSVGVRMALDGEVEASHSVARACTDGAPGELYRLFGGEYQLTLPVDRSNKFLAA